MIPLPLCWPSDTSHRRLFHDCQQEQCQELATFMISHATWRLTLGVCHISAYWQWLYCWTSSTSSSLQAHEKYLATYSWSCSSYLYASGAPSTHQTTSNFSLDSPRSSNAVDLILGRTTVLRYVATQRRECLGLSTTSGH